MFEPTLSISIHCYFTDLYDWSQKGDECKVTVARIKRRSSMTGGGMKIELNDTEIALFRYRDNVYAIKERCPHAGTSI